MQAEADEKVLSAKKELASLKAAIDGSVKQDGRTNARSLRYYAYWL